VYDDAEIQERFTLYAKDRGKCLAYRFALDDAPDNANLVSPEFVSVSQNRQHFSAACFPAAHQDRAHTK
jgi:hypothetical protein